MKSNRSAVLFGLGLRLQFFGFGGLEALGQTKAWSFALALLKALA